MYPFVAVILICLNSVPSEACDETTAADVMSTGVENELSCVMGWQDVVARSALAKEVGRTAYVKTLCRRARPASAGGAKFPVFPVEPGISSIFPANLPSGGENGEPNQPFCEPVPVAA